MSIGFYTGVAGMMSYQQELDNVANNIANVNTYGYKNTRTSFSDLLYSRMNTRVEGGFQTGHGVRVKGVDVLYGQSGLVQTSLPLDFAILGDGFFAVDHGGNTEYTRNGAFNLSISGKKAFLVTSDGASVLDAKGKPIAVPVDSNGQPDLEGLDEKLGVYVIQNPYGLEQSPGSRFLLTGNTGTVTELSKVKASQKKEDEPDAKVMAGSLELSSVDLGNEMTKVIQAQRAFQLNARVVQTADQLDEVINNLR